MKNKIGKLFILGLPGPSIPAWIKGFAKKFGLGGIILYERNFSDIDELKRLNEAIKRELNPAFIAVDQEGGEKRRIFVDDLIAPSEMGKTGDLKFIFESYRESALRLARLGFNLNLAPVCDIARDNSYIGKRSFGSNPTLVALAVRQAVLGIKAGRLSACAKHFPGLGKSTIDPHLSLPKLETTIDELKRVELLPFRESVRAGVDLIMTTHLFLPGIFDSIVTYSKEAVDFLRQSLDFSGIVVSDDLLMGALTGDTVEERVRKTLEAGHDMVIISRPEDNLVDICERLDEKMFEINIKRVETKIRRLRDGRGEKGKPQRIDT